MIIIINKELALFLRNDYFKRIIFVLTLPLLFCQNTLAFLN